MERWDKTKGERGDFTENVAVDRFIEEIIEVCKRHNLSISHEDGHGAFLIEEQDEHNFGWLRNAHIAVAL